jgi:hypothetical protein
MTKKYILIFICISALCITFRYGFNKGKAEGEKLITKQMEHTMRLIFANQIGG